MTEEEFRCRLHDLGNHYQSAIRDMNATTDQFLKNKCRDRGYAVMAEISALEKLYRAQGKELLIVADPVVEPRSVEPDPTSPWIDYYDQLIEEWFDGELALVDDLYSATKPPPSRPREPQQRARSQVVDDLLEFGKVFVGIIVITALVVWANWIMQIFAWR